MSEHTREPWEHVETRVYLGNEGGFDIRGCPTPEANARRIVACVNACEGVPTEELETGEVHVVIHRKLDPVDLPAAFPFEITREMEVDKLVLVSQRLQQQRDKLLEALKTAEAIIADEFTAFDRDLTAGGELTQIRAIIAEIEAAK